jgi:hypothetical protein
MIDPEQGWKYGFPKTAPPEEIHDIIQWLWDNGYPKYKYPGYVRYFETDGETKEENSSKNKK